jgi:hypothetical protein
LKRKFKVKSIIMNLFLLEIRICIAYQICESLKAETCG